MSVQKSRHMDTLQAITSAFQHFEKKLDKLQEDVTYHGHTLSELTVMVANLSAGKLMAQDTKMDSMKRAVNNTAIQYDEGFHIEGPLKYKRKKVFTPLPSKITAKSFDSQKYGTRAIKEQPYKIKKLPSNAKSPVKHILNHKKIEASHKPTIVRTLKATEK